MRARRELDVLQRLTQHVRPPKELHIATHGGERDGQPAVELAPGNWMTVGMLAATVLIPPVVVLTVCPVAYRSDAPHPPHRLPDALLHAGAKVVVAPLWPIRDSAAAAFSALFYANLTWTDMLKRPAHTVAAAVTTTVRELQHLTTGQLAARHLLLPLGDLRADPTERPFADVRDHGAWTCWS
ncbi:CHAT domain-containing protein [Mycolicibacterium vinylchloridicum]|uniref:CHAT domain-containing protein n=1 Tax=Mycolicibacterium vinylchloridicum TaxID=2736928 RepID=UPI0009DB04AA